MLQFNLIMICIIHKILVFLKINRILKCSLRHITDFHFFKTSYVFSQQIMMKSLCLEKENIIKYVRNIFRFEKTKKETIDTTIKGMRNLFGQEKK